MRGVSLTRPLIAFLAVAAALFFLRTTVLAACSPDDPTGYYEGTAQSKEAGALKVSVNLRCDGGKYGGTIIIPVGTFDIRDGSYANGQLTLRFGGGAIGDAGIVTLQVTGDKASGTFQLGADSGPFMLTRVGDARAPVSNETKLNLTTQQWREDLQFVVTELSTKHVAPFKFTSRAEFAKQAGQLDSVLDRLDADKVYVGMDHLANLIGDGHTYVEFPADLALFPVIIQRFGNDYRVVEATGDGTRALGMRVLRINGMPVQDVKQQLYDAITPIGETTVLRDARAENFLSIGMALHGIGVLPTRDKVTYTVANDAGKERDVALNALTPADAASARWSWVFAKRPLYRQQPDNNFWYTYLAPRKAVYLSWRAYTNFATLGPQFIAFVKGKNPAKVIVDLRLNGGGDYKAGLEYILKPLAAKPAINRTGHLYVLVGRNTFSAAMSNAAQFRTTTHAQLVGQTIGERPNSAQEPNEERLPNSRLLLRYSTQIYTFLPASTTNAIVPDKEIMPTWAQFKAGMDPVLEWSLAN